MLCVTIKMSHSLFPLLKKRKGCVNWYSNYFDSFFFFFLFAVFSFFSTLYQIFQFYKLWGQLHREKNIYIKINMRLL